jgi:cobalt-zinc-cadmium efflux system protein
VNAEGSEPLGRTHTAAGSRRGRLKVVFWITLAVLVAELSGGLLSHSLALLADAGHMFADVAGLGLGLGAIWLAHRPTAHRRTFGYYRIEILAAAVNAMLLFGVSVLVLFEAVNRLKHPPVVTGGLMLGVAVLALMANGVSLSLLHEGQRKSLNLRAAYLEVLGDLLGAAAVMSAAVIIAATGYERADPIASIVVGLLILPRTWKLLQEAVDVLLEAAPRGVDLDEVRRHVLEMPGVADVHDLHAWAITSGMNVVSAHVVIQDWADASGVLDGLSDCLAGDFDIEHSTFQLESRDRRRIEEAGHP